VVQLESVLKGHAFSRAVSRIFMAAIRMRKKSVLLCALEVLLLLLGGAAVHRCGNCNVLNAALAAEGCRFSTTTKGFREDCLP